MSSLISLTLSLGTIALLHMFAMDYSGRRNDDIDDGTTEDSPLRERGPGVFYDSVTPPGNRSVILLAKVLALNHFWHR